MQDTLTSPIVKFLKAGLLKAAGHTITVTGMDMCPPFGDQGLSHGVALHAHSHIPQLMHIWPWPEGWLAFPSPSLCL